MHCSLHPEGVRSIASGVSVCLSARISKNMSKFHKIFSTALHMVVARFFPDDNAVRYVFPVLWMTSRFHIMMSPQWSSTSDPSFLSKQTIWLVGALFIRWRGGVCRLPLPCLPGTFHQLLSNDLGHFNRKIGCHNKVPWAVGKRRSSP